MNSTSQDNLTFLVCIIQSCQVGRKGFEIDNSFNVNVSQCCPRFTNWSKLSDLDVLTTLNSTDMNRLSFQVHQVSLGFYTWPSPGVPIWLRLKWRNTPSWVECAFETDFDQFQPTRYDDVWLLCWIITRGCRPTEECQNCDVGFKVPSGDLVCP